MTMMTDTQLAAWDFVARRTCKNVCLSIAGCSCYARLLTLMAVEREKGRLEALAERARLDSAKTQARA